MIKIIKKILLATALLGSNAYLMAGCPFNILNPEINPRPLTYLSTGNVSFEILEDKGVAIPATDDYGEATCKFDIELSYVMLENNDTANITGPLLEYFDVEYNNAERKIYFTQNKDIPADTYAKGIVSVDVTEESTNAQKYNGFQLNVYASEIEGNQYTYTKKQVLPPEVLIVDGTDVNETDPTTVITNDTTPEINGTCDVNNTVTVQIDGEDIEPTVDCSDDGTFSITPTEEIPEGEHNITATQYFPDENTTSAPSPVDYLNVDTTAPEQLTIDTIDSQTGSPVTTLDKTPEINGTCTPDDNGTVTVQIDGVDIFPTAICTPEGTYSIVPDNNISVGNHIVTSTESDDAGNTREAGPVNLIIENPEVPAIEVLSIDGNDVNETNPTDVLTNDNTPEINGTCDAGNTVTVQIDGSDIEPDTTCKEDGTFSITPNNPIDDGNHTVTATQTDPNTNVESEKSPVDYLIVDTLPSAKPLIYIMEDANNDGNISQATELVGNVNVIVALPYDAEVDDILTVINPDGTTITITVTQDLIDNGYLVEYTPVLDGTEIVVQAYLTDKAGNVSATSEDRATIIDDVAPEPLTIEKIDDKTGTPVRTTETKPVIEGTCAYNDNGTVTVQIDGDIITPNGICTPAGTYSITPNYPIEVGEHNVTTIESDDNGNTATSNSVELIVEYPEVPAVTIVTIDGDDVNETDPTTVITSNPKPLITGVCTTGNYVTVKVDNEDIAPHVVCQDGHFTVTPTNNIPEGVHPVTAIQTDPNTNVTSEPSPVDYLNVDTTEPTAPIVTITEDIDNNGEISQANELNGNINVLVTVPAGTNVGDVLTVTNPDGTTVNVTVTSDIITSGHPLEYAPIAVGETLTVKATLKDQAGNVSVQSEDSAIVVDDVAPETLTIDNVDGQTGIAVTTTDRTPEINGTCTPDDNGTVVIQIDGEDITPTTTCTDEGTYSVSPDTPLAAGVHSVTASESDNAGNTKTTPAVALTIEINAPDYDVALSISKTTFIDNAESFFATIRITEVVGGVNTGDVVYSINKNSNIVLSFDGELSANPDGVIVSNSDFEWIETSSKYELVYKGNGRIFPASDRVYVGVAGVFTPPSGAKGKFFFKVNLRLGSGDTNENNDQDSEAISYSNIH